MAVVGIAVAAIPEGLPAVLTVTLAIGVRRMAARRAVVRRLPAVETLGSVTVICSDKTGTLTRNEMTVRAVVTAGASFDVTGTGYEPRGAFALAGRAVDPAAHPALAGLARAAALCNDAALRRGAEGWAVDGDPMEGALLALALKAGLDPAALARELPRADAIPFDAAHRFMATLHHDHPRGAAFACVKGAPERVVAMCDRQLGPGGEEPLDAQAWLARVDALAAQGQRVLAVATKAVPADARALTFADVERGAVLLGLVGLIDPPREEAVAAVRDCRAAGIRVKMITGDHAATARAIAGQLGLEVASVAEGRDLDRLDGAALRRVARDTDVFARTSPEHKLRLVEALQAEGAVVAMTGDGVNDAPALKRADVGVAMGRKGTEAAKEAAQMVLADDNFATIAAAVREGRVVYDNLRKVIAWSLPTNVGEAFCIVAADPARADAADHPGPDPLGQHGHRGHARAGARVRAGRAGRDAPPAAGARRAAALGLPGVAGGPGLGPPPGRHLRPVRVGDAARAAGRGGAHGGGGRAGGDAGRLPVQRALPAADLADLDGRARHARGAGRGGRGRGAPARLHLRCRPCRRCSARGRWRSATGWRSWRRGPRCSRCWRSRSSPAAASGWTARDGARPGTRSPRADGRTPRRKGGGGRPGAPQPGGPRRGGRRSASSQSRSRP